MLDLIAKVGPGRPDFIVEVVGEGALVQPVDKRFGERLTMWPLPGVWRVLLLRDVWHRREILH